MLGFVVRRVALGVLTLLAVSMLTFVMFFALPRDPVTAMCPKNCDAARLDRVRAELGLDDPALDDGGHPVLEAGPARRALPGRHPDRISLPTPRTGRHP